MKNIIVFRGIGALICSNNDFYLYAIGHVSTDEN